MRKDQDSAVEALVEQLIEGGSENMATVGDVPPNVEKCEIGIV